MLARSDAIFKSCLFIFCSHKQELTAAELIEMQEQEHDMEELESVDPVQSEHRMVVGNLIESLSLIGKKECVCLQPHDRSDIFKFCNVTLGIS
ncbi:hypothetical protein TNCV_2657551 [Trichonephila clavipes]|uniref:Uncharacterized protein n=1 Tax=Trichonephila clavipes TaxID=2585209 RepID=A0A8X6RJR0_TRICX|nr:hypothetical protein TNCV_2657551 [Trichonephila clavipes]